MADEQPCPICQAKDVGTSMMRDYRLGKRSAFQIAGELGTTVDLVMKHVNEEHELNVDEEGYLQSQDKLLAELLKTLKTLKVWTDFVVATVTDPKDIDRAKVDMLVRLSQEARKTIESVATLQGRKGPGDTYVQMQILNNRVMLLTDTILDAACDDCKVKILEAIERQPALVGETAHGTRDKAIES